MSVFVFNEGDYFRWSYKRHVYDQNPLKVQAGTVTWCCAMILKVVRGELTEIYWGERKGQDDKRWSFEDAMRDMNLHFIANVNNLEVCLYPKFYDPCLVHDLRHCNDSSNSRIMMLKGSQRSRPVMIAYAEQEALSHIGVVRHAEWLIKELDKKIIAMEEGADLTKIYL